MFCMDFMEVIAALCDEAGVHQRYFDARSGTDMHAIYLPSAGCVRWTYRFLDVGMTHTVRGKARVVARGGGICVNNVRVNSVLEATDRAYKGRLARFVRRLYTCLRVPVN